VVLYTSKCGRLTHRRKASPAKTKTIAKRKSYRRIVSIVSVFSLWECILICFGRFKRARAANPASRVLKIRPKRTFKARLKRLKR
jgi:hypothetical protein